MSTTKEKPEMKSPHRSTSPTGEFYYRTLNLVHTASPKMAGEVMSALYMFYGIVADIEYLYAIHDDTNIIHTVGMLI